MEIDIQQIARELGIDKPIMRHELVDNRLKIYLYGGDIIEYLVSTDTTVPDADIIANPHIYTRKQLRPVAERLGIANAQDMNKRPLVKAIKDWQE